jgi:hypothetical protein
MKREVLSPHRECRSSNRQARRSNRASRLSNREMLSFRSKSPEDEKVCRTGSPSVSRPGSVVPGRAPLCERLGLSDSIRSKWDSEALDRGRCTWSLLFAGDDGMHAAWLTVALSHFDRIDLLVWRPPARQARDASDRTSSSCRSSPAVRTAPYSRTRMDEGTEGGLARKAEGRKSKPGRERTGTGRVDRLDLMSPKATERRPTDVFGARTPARRCPEREPPERAKRDARHRACGRMASYSLTILLQ